MRCPEPCTCCLLLGGVTDPTRRHPLGLRCLHSGHGMLALPGVFASRSMISLFTQQTCTDHPQLRLPEHLLSVQLRVLGFHMFLIHGCFSINNQGSISRLHMGNRSLDNGFIQYCLLALYPVPGIMPQGLGIEGERKQMWLLLLWPDLLTGSVWGSQESASGPLVFSGVQSQCVSVCLAVWWPQRLTASLHSVGSKFQAWQRWQGPGKGAPLIQRGLSEMSRINSKAVPLRPSCTYTLPGSLLKCRS